MNNTFGFADTLFTTFAGLGFAHFAGCGDSMQGDCFVGSTKKHRFQGFPWNIRRKLLLSGRRFIPRLFQERFSLRGDYEGSFPNETRINNGFLENPETVVQWSEKMNGSDNQKMVTVKVDGQAVSVSDKTTILQAAQKAGVHIPTLCYHPRLSPIGSCRVCLVRVKGYEKPVTSCDTPVCEGMKVTTSDAEIERLRKQAIQFVLLNHPLECPVCDKAGECSLQDITYKLNVTRQEHFTSTATWENDTGSPLIFRSDGRCIRCGRCVAICNEVQNVGALDFFERGYKARIAPVRGEVLNCEFCGQCISVCPVGALLSKPFLNQMRVWDLDETESVCAFCGAGCSVEIQSRDDTVYRVVSNHKTTHNRGDLCSRGTFGFSFLKGHKRLALPLERKEGRLESTNMEVAIETAVGRLKEIIEKYGPDAVAGIGSARLTNEDAFAFAGFIKEVVGSVHLDTDAGAGYRQILRRTHRKPLGKFNDLETCDSIALLGSDLAVEMPVPSLRVIAAAKRKNARVLAAAPYRTKLHRISTDPVVYQPGGEGALALALAQVAVDENLVPPLVSNHKNYQEIKDQMKNDLKALCELAGIYPDQAKKAARRVFKGKKRAVVIGPYGYRDSVNRKAMALLTWLIDPEVFFVSSEWANAQGVMDVGCIPGIDGLGYRQIFPAIESGKIKALWVAGSDPAGVFKAYAKALPSLELLVVQDPFMSETAKAAHVVLPVAPWSQKQGTTTSAEGRVQFQNCATTPPEGVKTDAEIFALAAERMGGLSESDPMVLRESISKRASGYGRAIFSGDNKGLFIGKEKTDRIPNVPSPPLPGRESEEGFWAVRASSLYINSTMASHSASLAEICTESYALFHPESMGILGIQEGQKADIRTEFGATTLLVKKSGDVPLMIALIVDNFAGSEASSLFSRIAGFAPASIKRSS